MSSSAPLVSRLLAFVTPRRDELGYGSLWSLLYLAFLFMNWNGAPAGVWLPPTLACTAVFLPLYFHTLGRCGRRMVPGLVLIALLGFVLAPINVGANTFVIYAACMVVHAGFPLRTIVAAIAVVIACYALELSLLGVPARYVVGVACVTLVVSLAISAASYFHREKQLRQAELKLSHDEVRRLGAMAERERIGRDLHDLLGHTLSLITLKAELATRLFERDPPAARREIAEVERVARDALAQVRRAVSGIRAAGLAAELASARVLLESCEVRLDYRLGDVALPPELETVFALVVREAVTNIQRHARASRVRVELDARPGEAQLCIEDDGRGGPIEPGNGLAGMRERLRAHGGRLEIRSTRGQGTMLLAMLPLAGASPAPVAAATTPLRGA